MIANYHTHTARCRHATGTEEEYIQNGLASGLQVLGFSDHTPYPFPEGYYSKMRMYPHELAEYVQTLSSLREKYAAQIRLHIGLEVEYYPAHFADLLTWVRDQDVEYLLLGQHWLGNEQGEVHVNRAFDDEARLARCCDQTIDAMQTGVFSYIAHPDLPNFVGDSKIYDRHMRRMIREANACGLPLEINLHGAMGNRAYPNPHFWELVAEEGGKAVLGRDAHDPTEFLDTATEQRMLNMVRQLELTLLPQIMLKKP